MTNCQLSMTFKGGDMNKFDEEKLRKIKYAIVNFGEDTLKKIITRTKEEDTIFFRKKAFEEFVTKYINEFDDDQLRILGFSYNTTPVENLEVIDEKEVPVPTNLSQISPALKTINNSKELGDKLLLLLNNLDNILEVTQEKSNRLIVPQEVLNKKPVPASIRISREILDEFYDLCRNFKNYSKTELLNYALYEFIKRYK